MSFNQGIPGPATLINSSAVLVTGNAASANALTVRQFGGGNVFSAQTTTGSTALFVGANGNVGIGLTNPACNLQLLGTLADTADKQGSPGANTFVSVTKGMGYATTTSAIDIDIGCSNRSVGDGGSVYKYRFGTRGTGVSARPLAFYVQGVPSTTYTADGTPVEYFTILGNGNVGIGTTNPGAPLHTTCNSASATTVATFENLTTTNTTNKSFSLQFYGRDTNFSQKDIGSINVIPTEGNWGYSAMAFSIRGPFGSGGNEAVSEIMRFTRSGTTPCVGIGTANPGYQMDMYNASSCVFRILSPSQGAGVTGAGIRLMEASDFYGFSFRNVEGRLGIYRHNNSTDGVEVMSFKRDGTNVGIGTTNPNSNVDIYSTATTAAGAATLTIQTPSIPTPVGADTVTSRIILGNSTYGPYIQSTMPNGSYSDGNRIEFATAATNNSTTRNVRMVIQAFTGNVGIGTASPSYPLHVNGTAASGSLAIKYINYPNVPTWTTTTGAVNYSIYATGNILTSDAFILTSDERIKKEEQPSWSYLAAVESVPVKTFSYIDQVQYGPQKRVGFFAQEVEKVLPDAVTKTKDFIPNIFAKCQAEGNCVTVVNHGLAEGTKVRVFSGQEKIESNVHVIDENTIELEKILEKDVFVFGTEVDDFRVLNYDYMSSVAFGGLKELSALVKTQAQTIETLSERLATLEAKLSA